MATMPMAEPTDEQLLLNLLNTTPVVDGQERDELGDFASARGWLAANGQKATKQEWQGLLEVRPVLQAIVRGERSPTALAAFLDGVGYRPRATVDGLDWDLHAPEGRVAAAKAVIAWDALRVSSPGRLRACANAECQLFLIDRSKPNSAKWCSMAVCGNRMKARRHYHRAGETA
ncbi:CGNR zinc finger domain-containing protein [Catenulispora sp. GAS73]|uniref:CGNR zinc finger domain-containing protein n=1 Tax=Catenulispora sp. GAS73 TaxID=3156269 RepID=UPI003517F49F